MHQTQRRPHDPSSLRPRRKFCVLWLVSGKAPTRRTAWILSAAALLLIFANLAVNLGLNLWNQYFYDALERKDDPMLLTSIGNVPIYCFSHDDLLTCETSFSQRKAFGQSQNTPTQQPTG
jgi:ABC-type uncharacterized transport system fused permease/ATPase subunit